MMSKATLPKVKIYATGGTIAGASDSTTDNLHYQAGSIGIQGLLDAVPEIHSIADVSGEQFLNVGSHEVRAQDLLKLSKLIQHDLDSGSADGVVVTHGTDTLEETAFFLDITVKTDKPIIVVGAMRPATAMSADGPLNLLQATALAASQQAKHRGVMIVMSDRIESAYYATKTHANVLDAFRSSEQGSLGLFQNTTPHFYFCAATPTNKPLFSLESMDEIPLVDIVYSHQDASADLLQAAVDRGAKGIVISAAGNGWASPALELAALALSKQGFPVVFSSRTGNGFAIKPPEQGIGSGLINTQKSRLVLMLAIANHYSTTQINQCFNGSSL
ncbi:MAG: asparaginase [Leucothrix sp.]